MVSRSRLLLPLILASALSARLPPLPPLAPHPRLVLTPARLAAARAEIAGGGDAGAFGALLFAHADLALAEAPTTRGPTDPVIGVLLQVRRALDIMLTSAAAAALNGTRGVSRGAPYFERALREVQQLCFNWTSPNNTDWNFAHALDTGEASFAVGLAYDWLYPALSGGERAGIAGALVAHGLGEYRAYLPGAARAGSPAWWANSSVNWNCVCSAGGVVGALAILGEPGAPAWLLDDVVAPLVAGVAPCVASVHADSSWTEGPEYWGYANKYNAWLFSALLSTWNSTLGLAALPGVTHAARFPIYMSGANVLTAANASLTWAWADSHSAPMWQPYMSLWGTAFDERAAAYVSRVASRALAPALVRAFKLHSNAWGMFVETTAFFDARGTAADVQALPTALLYDVAQLAVFRSPWLAPQQSYLGFKGGNSSWDHAHCDMGSFVFDTGGQRFAEDLGADSYELPSYFGPQRWSYYRLNSLGHNVPVFANASQVPAAANITAFCSAPVERQGVLVDGWGVIDLSRAYAGAGAPAAVRRGVISLNASSAVVIVDEFAPTTANISWRLHTRAAAELDGARAALALGGVDALLALLPASAGTDCAALGAWTALELAPLLPSPPYNPAAGYRRLELLAQSGDTCTRIAVALGEPAIVIALAQARIAPLDAWPTAGPL